MAKENMHLITLIDRSGSMDGKVLETVSAYNELLGTFKAKKMKVCTSLLSFDEEVKVLRARESLKNAKLLSSLDADIQPRGMTALYDAIIRACVLGNPNEPTLVQVISDGMENASQEITKEAIQRRIKRCEKDGWEFMFVGMDINAEKAASGLHFAANSMGASATMSVSSQGMSGPRGPFGEQGPVGATIRSYYESSVKENTDEHSKNSETDSGV